jgi:hypothetical protein
MAAGITEPPIPGHSSRTDDRLRVALNGITVATTSTAAALDGWIAFRVAAG